MIKTNFLNIMMHMFAIAHGVIFIFFKYLPGSDRPHVRTCSGKSWIVLGDATSSIRFLVPEIRTKALVSTTIRNNKDISLSHLHFNLTVESNTGKNTGRNR